MGKFGSEDLILTESFGPPSAAVDLGMAMDKDGNKITTAGAEVVAIAGDDFDQGDIDANTANPVTSKTLTGVTLGLCRVLLGATVAKGDKGAVDTAGKFRTATAGQAVAVEFRSGGVAGDLVEAFKLPQRSRVATAANADTSGATLGQLETEVNELKALLRAQGLLAP
jgi:hypothetical protein